MILSSFELDFNECKQTIWLKLTQQKIELKEFNKKYNFTPRIRMFFVESVCMSRSLSDGGGGGEEINNCVGVSC
jgi:hypothetical protein